MNKNKKRYEYHSKNNEQSVTYNVNKDSTLLDFLFSIYKDSSKNFVKGLLANHHVSVDGAPVSQFDLMLHKGDTVIIFKRPIKQKVRTNLPIIYEDENYIALNKPSGLLSVASDKEKISTAYRILTDYVQQKDKHNRVYIVHRLDEDTSGVFIVVKNSKLKDVLQDNWNDVVKKRGYYAIVEGQLKNKEGRITSYLKKNGLNLMYSTKEKDGQYAITNYKVLKENEKYSLLDVNIETGRKNQIRVHLGERGHHIIGDDKYGEPSNPLGRLGLHAYELSLIDPISKKLMIFKAPMPKEFNELLDGTYVQKVAKKPAKTKQNAKKKKK